MKQISKDEILKIIEERKIGKFQKIIKNGGLEVIKTIEGATNHEKIFKYIHPEKLANCLVCGSITKFDNIYDGFRKTCSKSCGAKIMWQKRPDENEIERQKKRKETNNQKYGCDYPMQVKEISEKISKSAAKKTKEEKERSNEKRKITTSKKYGVDNIAKSELSKEKFKQTMLENHGVENPSYSNEIVEKRKNTHREKYGVDNIFQLYSTKEKIKTTNLKKYGVENPSQSPEIAIKKLKNSHLKKEFVFPSGQVGYVQGYETFVLNELLKSYDENELVVNPSKMPAIWYIGVDGEKHRYFPDIFIPHENKIVEVKSDYTFKICLETNLLKKQRCLELGYVFEFKIFNSKMVEVKEEDF